MNKKDIEELNKNIKQLTIALNTLIMLITTNPNNKSNKDPNYVWGAEAKWKI